MHVQIFNWYTLTKMLKHPGRPHSSKDVQTSIQKRNVYCSSETWHLLVVQCFSNIMECRKNRCLLLVKERDSNVDDTVNVYGIFMWKTLQIHRSHKDSVYKKIKRYWLYYTYTCSYIWDVYVYFKKTIPLLYFLFWVLWSFW